MNSLWGEMEQDNFLTPNKILEEQGNYLPKLTKDYVYGFVERNTKKEEIINQDDYRDIDEDEGEFHEDSWRFVYDFYIRGKFLENYRYLLIEVCHRLATYPLELEVDQNMFSEISPQLGKINLNFAFSKDRILKIDNDILGLK